MSQMLTGKELCSLMRRHKVTIRELSKRMGITLIRIRARRELGFDEPNVARDWIQAVTGKDPGPYLLSSDWHKGIVK